MTSVLVIPTTGDWFELDRDAHPLDQPYVLHMTEEQFEEFREYGDHATNYVNDEKMRLPAKFGQYRVASIVEA